MAELKPYDPNKPYISVNLPTKEELIAATLGLIPGYRALKNFHDNPEGPISETLDLAAEDLVPLYGSLIKPAIKGEDIDWNTAGKEAAMNAFALPVFLRNSKKGYIVKPKNTAELNKFNKAIDAAVAKGEISAADLALITGKEAKESKFNWALAKVKEFGESDLGKMAADYATNLQGQTKYGGTMVNAVAQGLPFVKDKVNLEVEKKPDVKNDPELQLLERIYSLHKKYPNMVGKPKLPKQWEKDYTIEEIFGK